jgi:hypothetical protein
MLHFSHVKIFEEAGGSPTKSGNFGTQSDKVALGLEADGADHADSRADPLDALPKYRSPHRPMVLSPDVVCGIGILSRSGVVNHRLYDNRLEYLMCNTRSYS